MAFPSSPLNGQTVTVNNTNYIYNSGTNTWQAVAQGALTTVVISAPTVSTSTTTGALTVSGGAGIAGNLYIGGNLSIAGNTTFINTQTITTTDTFAAPAINAGTIGNSGTLFTGANINVTGIAAAANVITTNGVFYPNGVSFSSPPQGSNTFIQFNDGGSSFGGATYLQYNKTSGNLVSNSTTSSYSTTAGALVIGGGVGVSGNVNAGKLQVGTISYSDTNILGMFQSSAGTYNQIILQNGQANPNASADIVVSNDLGTASTYYGDFGMNSSNFGGTGSLNQPSAVYLTGTSGDLVLGTTTANAIHFVVSSSTTDALTIFSNSSVVSNGNVIISNTVASTSTTTGALVVNGGAGIAGNLNIGGANVIVASGSIMANGVYTETTTTPGVYLGNLNATPRIGFFNGNASANWQIDNNVGSFRWYTPGVTRMTIDYFGNLTMPGATFITNSAVSTSSSTGALVVSGGVGVSGALFVGGNISDFAGSVRDIVNNAQSGAYVLTGADNGKMINITTGGVTINTGIFNAGNNITIYNNSGSSQTITQGSGVTMYLAGTATTGNRTLLQHGLATIVCVANSTTFVISGAGLQ